MGMVALALPFAVLILLIVVSVRSISRSRKEAKLDETPATGRYGTSLTADEEAPALPAPSQPAQPIQLSGERLLRAIEAAERSGHEQDMAGLYLQFALELLKEARPADAAQVLTRCVRYAAKFDQRRVQAQARIELGDLARTNGDLTTACEHWQMARTLLHDLKKLAEFEIVDRKMRQNGCPTDWVLNDF
jgi:hypothetical protein